ncbi:hypothetical protein LJR045_000998 [Microbacterium sp. LjRoot45]|uniref:hypothetical protein n=1 Tax=Microbacterium sp. LjRoot45 TaxID=3342329 RepID=UPI003ED07015
MSDAVIPPGVKLAAKRGFVRTTAQAYAATIPTGGISAAAIIAFAAEPNWLVAGITVGVALASPPLAGLASYLSIISKGVPAEYQEASAGSADAVDGEG